MRPNRNRGFLRSLFASQSSAGSESADRKPSRSARRGTRRFHGLETLEARRLFAADAVPQLAVFPDASAERVPGEIVIGFRSGVRLDDIRGLAQAHGLSRLQDLYMGSESRVARMAQLPDQAVEAVLRVLRRHPLVEYAEPSFMASAFLAPNDALYRHQWHLQSPGAGTGSINVQAAWQVTNGSGVKVAVLDTGVAYENRSDATGTYFAAPDFAGTHFVPGYDFINNDPFANDDNSHGTHVAGTIAQSTHNSIGTAGVAYGASIMPVKVLGRDGSGSHATIAQGIRWAADQGAHIINLSLGSSSGSTVLRDALAYAYNKGVTIVAAAGNNGTGSVSFPAAYDDFVIAVGATRFDETRAPYSNFGSSIDLAAPGGDVTVDQNGDGIVDGVLQNTFNPSTRNTRDFGYYLFQGTSMAAPHVSGVAALVVSQLLEHRGSAPPDIVRSILQTTARDIGAAGVDTFFGHGIVDATAAVAATAAFANKPPVAVADSATTGQNQAVVIPVLANDSDPDGDPFRVVATTQPAQGSVTLNRDGTLTYTPRTGFHGTDSFRYTIADPAGATSSATVTVTVQQTAIVRIADLDGAVRTQRSQWQARVTAQVVNGFNQPVAGATVTGRWSDGRTVSGITDSLGNVVFGSAWQWGRTTSMTFSVTHISASGLTYAPTLNSDPDGDSNGTTITVFQSGATSSSRGLLAGSTLSNRQSRLLQAAAHDASLLDVLQELRS
jgi:serine protease